MKRKGRQSAKNQKRYRKANKKRGKCQRCGGALPEGYEFVTCQKCRDDNKAWRDKKRSEQSVKTIQKAV